MSRLRNPNCDKSVGKSEPDGQIKTEPSMEIVQFSFQHQNHTTEYKSTSHFYNWTFSLTENLLLWASKIVIVWWSIVKQNRPKVAIAKAMVFALCPVSIFRVKTALTVHLPPFKGQNTTNITRLLLLSSKLNASFRLEISRVHQKPEPTF